MLELDNLVRSSRMACIVIVCLALVVAWIVVSPHRQIVQPPSTAPTAIGPRDPCSSAAEAVK